MTPNLIPKSRWRDAQDRANVHVYPRILDRKTKKAFDPGYMVPFESYLLYLCPAICFVAQENDEPSDLDLVIQGVFYDS